MNWAGHHAAGSAGPCPPALRRPGGGDRAVASRSKAEGDSRSAARPPPFTPYRVARSRTRPALVALADDSSGRALPVWLSGPEGHGLLRDHGHHPHPEPAEVITADLLRAAGVTVTGVDIDELNPALTTGPQHGRGLAQAAARIEFTAASTAEPGQMPVRIGYALAMAAATGAPIRMSDLLINRCAGARPE